MPRAFLVGPPDPELDPAPLRRMVETLGFEVVDEPAADLSSVVDSSPEGPVALIDRRWMGHQHALRLALLDARRPANALPGVLTVGPAVRPAVARAVSGRCAADVAPEMVARELADTHAVAVADLDPAPLVAAVPTDAVERAAVQERVRAVDEERARLDHAIRMRDTSFFPTYLVNPYSRHIASWCARRGITANQVTVVSLLVALMAAASCLTATRAGFVAGAILLQVSFVLDCVDGQVARYTVNFSPVGAWFDALFDRVKEYAVFAALAVAAGGDSTAWLLAAAAMALQTARHVLHFGYTEAGAGVVSGAGRAITEHGFFSSHWVRKAIVLPIGERWALISFTMAFFSPRVVFLTQLAAGGFAYTYAAAGRALRSLRRDTGWTGADPALRTMLDTGPLARLAATVPTLVPALPAAVTGSAVLAAALVAVHEGRSAWWLVAAATVYAATIGQALAGRLEGKLDWLLPTIARGAEYVTVLAVAASAASATTGTAGTAAAGFALIAASAYRQYDAVYQLRSGRDAEAALASVAGGHEGRILAVALAAALAPGQLSVVLTGLAALGAAVGVTASARWLRWVGRRTARASGQGVPTEVATAVPAPQERV